MEEKAYNIKSTIFPEEMAKVLQCQGFAMLLLRCSVLLGHC